MKNILAVAAAATGLLMTAPALAALPVGAVAPTFKTTAALAGAQTQFDLAAALKKGPVVLYFFPAAFTPGCTAEANEFAEATADFNAAGATIIGMTGGNVDRIAEFSKVECRDKFAVGATTPAMIKAYDVALAVRPGWTSRVSYVIGQDGKIAFVHNAGDFRGHVSGTLAAVRKLKK
jgi:thioredoxin-dependent peroxiredoxin